jgi:hypothetical protein
MVKRHITAVERRRKEIFNQLDHLRSRLSTKTRKDYRSEHRYLYWRKQYQELIDKLEDELSVLEDPGSYAELPLAVVADELGLDINQVKHLVRRAEILVSGKSPHQRISREELEHASEIGPAELLRCSSEDCWTIFDVAISQLQAGYIELADRSYRRIAAREAYPRTFEPALRIAVELAEGASAKVHRLLGIVLKKEPVQKAVIMTLLERCLNNLKLQGQSIQILAEQILSINKAKDTEEPKNNISRKASDELEETAIYLATTILHALANLSKKPLPASRLKEIEPIIRDTIYTALYARVHYDESLTYRSFVEAMSVLSAQNSEPAKLLDNLISKR